MPIDPKYLATFITGETYHVYNRTNNQELLFRCDDNYRYFLKQFVRYISPVADTYAWSLLPNHFHFLIKIKLDSEIKDWIEQLPKELVTKSQKQYLIDGNLDVLIQMELNRFFISYAMAFNKMYHRTGNLFARTFKRIRICKNDQFTQAVLYINSNAQKHRIVKKYTDYIWSSYNSIISKQPTKLLRSELLNWFGSLEEFINAHQEISEHYYID